MALRLAGKRFNYTLIDDRKSDAPTVFVIRELNAGQRAALFDGFADAMRLAELCEADKPTESQSREMLDLLKTTRQARLDTCLTGIESITGVIDADGSPVSLTVAEVMHKIKDPATIDELAEAVLSANTLSGDEKKILPTPPASPGQGAAA